MAQGYKDTPIIQNSIYHVHDCDRPQPPVVTPGSSSTQQAIGAAPSDAVILFDGSSLDGWKQVKTGEPCEWELVDGDMLVKPGTGDIISEKEFGDCQLHVEFMSPVVIKGEGQGRGNSGVFLMGLYEIQVLDCYENPTYPDGTTGGIYGQFPPLANACRKPGEWNMYDIIFKAPVFDGDTLVSPAYVTVILNGVLLHHCKEMYGPTQHKILAEYKPQPPVGPLKLQDHGDLVKFRNIWYREIPEYDQY